MFTVLEPEAQAPEVYRNTPFEHLLTADAGQLVVMCTIPIPAAQAWVVKAGTVQVGAPLPGWMAVRPNVPRPTPEADPGFEQPATPLA
jgi:hypothetical protein